MLVRLDGALVCAPPARSYSFDADDGQHREGTTRKAWIVQSFDAAPVIVAFRDEYAEAFEKLRAMGGGERVSLMVDSGRSVRFVGWCDEAGDR